ncbi:hypothetical protein GGR56DRAFT_619751 [Xylariaceae sp. FL0804]|nr:hypothetical protein GGR56DRAFT_619751 [Xylariaceae sp. FL0804]
MVIPLLAIITCAMLASNSPSTLDGIVYDGGDVAPPDRYEADFPKQQLERAQARGRPLAPLARRFAGYSAMETAFEVSPGPRPPLRRSSLRVSLFGFRFLCLEAGGLLPPETQFGTAQ